MARETAQGNNVLSSVAKKAIDLEERGDRSLCNCRSTMCVKVPTRHDDAFLENASGWGKVNRLKTPLRQITIDCGYNLDKKRRVRRRGKRYSSSPDGMRPISKFDERRCEYSGQRTRADVSKKLNLYFVSKEGRGGSGLREKGLRK